MAARSAPSSNARRSSTRCATASCWCCRATSRSSAGMKFSWDWPLPALARAGPSARAAELPRARADRRLAAGARRAVGASSSTASGPSSSSRAGRCSRCIRPTATTCRSALVTGLVDADRFNEVGINFPGRLAGRRLRRRAAQAARRSRSAARCRARRRSSCSRRCRTSASRATTTLADADHGGPGRLPQRLSRQARDAADIDENRFIWRAAPLAGCAVARPTSRPSATARS